MSCLLDTGFLYATLNTADQRHAVTLEIISQIREEIILPVPAITEVVYLLKRDLGAEAAADFTGSLADSTLTLQTPVSEDFRRAAGLMRQYADAKLDFVDALIAALAERLKITRILTLDQRDFRLIRPRHCTAFDLLP